MSKHIRCAIYTRKSTEEGLEQDFNSLDAQREACEAYIQSQKGLGWIVLKKRYDDGGLSGGNMDRPALHRLLRDIESGKVDLVVVYKVDRLTRSLMDFARIIDTFDATNVSFVSVTQQFNTANSMGRLTLNVLLSFAQFEREVTAERIRDKIAASKKKGMWMGGLPPLGYDSVDKKLIVNPGEASVVRALFDLYLQLGSIRDVKAKADHLGYRTKKRKTENRYSGDKLFTKGHLAQLLRNPIYVGQIAHKGKMFDGQHAAIIDQDIWVAVQDKLNKQSQTRHTKTNKSQNCLLTGILFDETGDRLTPTYARQYRYYVSKRLIDNANAEGGWRIPAKTIEDTVVKTVSPYLNQKTQNARDLISKVTILPDKLRINFAAKPSGYSPLLDATKPEPDVLEVPVRIHRRGVERKIIIEGQGPAPTPNAELIKLVSDAHRWFHMITSGQADTVREIAEMENVDAGDISRFLKLAFLNPEIVESIFLGTQPITLTAETLKRLARLPKSWRDQKKLLSYAK